MKNNKDSDMLEKERSAVMEDTEAQLRAEIEELKRQLERQKQHAPKSTQTVAHPSRIALWVMALVGAVLIVAGFFTGYIPHQRRESVLASEAMVAGKTDPVVNVVAVERSSGSSELVLPGNIQAVTEAPVLSRSNGYVKLRHADIGDRVNAGQILAELEAPELVQQLYQAQAVLEQASSAVEQAMANLQRARTDEKLAQITAQRWSNLFQRGVVSRQENDNYQAQYDSQKANVQALEKAVAASKSNVSAAQANVARLTELKGFSKVRAPFTGVITVRNVDTGALVTEGNTLLFRIAQMDRLRTYVNLPQADAGSVRVGQSAYLTIAGHPGRKFPGIVTRTANVLDPSSRTLLVEVQVPNPDGALMPGMYAEVDLTTPRKNPPLLIPGDTLVVRSDGTQVAVIGDDHTVRYQRIQLGRDFGDRIEVLSGLEAGQKIVVNPGDTVRQGTKVNPVLLAEKAAGK
jgi:RND family efflux transporter MFP subunit